MDTPLTSEGDKMRDKRRGETGMEREREGEEREGERERGRGRGERGKRGKL